MVLHPEHPCRWVSEGFPGHCPTISKQSPGWISSLALKPRWRMRIWAACEKKRRSAGRSFHVSNQETPLWQMNLSSSKVSTNKKPARLSRKRNKQEVSDPFIHSSFVLPKRDTELRSPKRSSPLPFLLSSLLHVETKLTFHLCLKKKLPSNLPNEDKLLYLWISRRKCAFIILVT